MLHFDDIVFGPIFSRRLGSSLGVNLLPSKGKLCNFDCVYCECGWNKDGIAERVFPRLEEVKAALEEKMSKAASEGVPVDSITFSGNGEPTMNPDFPEIIDVTLELRDRYFPDAKVSVLSNATLIGRPAVAEALMKVDNPILKIDASSDSLIAQINKPVGRYRLDEVVEAMMKFEGRFVLQTMFLKSPDFDTAEPDALEKWMEIVRKVKPREIMVYTIDRETPDKSLAKYTVEEMTAFVQPLIDEGFRIQIRG
ncbi:MAG: radical SAM protein [Bacteroidales bacterium]|nr:radical SAM protein [Bacteroidales bacterium]MBQ8810315.1 radical SAM protein [Bacteroidales bacterium]